MQATLLGATVTCDMCLFNKMLNSLGLNNQYEQGVKKVDVEWTSWFANIGSAAPFTIYPWIGQGY